MQELKTVYKAFLELVKIGIGTSDRNFDFSVLSDEEWARLFTESKKQASALLCFDSLKETNVKPKEELYNRWFIFSAATIKNNICVIEEQNKLVELLNSNTIPYVILKGTSSGNYYPDGKTRCSGDIDFIVDNDDLEKTRALLLENEYVLDNDNSPIHYEFRKGKVRVELHKKISGIPDNKYGPYFVKSVDKIIEDAVLENGFNRPSDFHHGIVIFLHMLHHLLNNGIGIRHLCDWACFVNKTHTESFWTEKLIPLLKTTGTFNFMCGLTIASVHLLNINRPLWCKDVPDEMLNTIVLEIGSSGNFGFKKQKKHSLIMTRMDSEKSSVFSKIRGMIKALHKTNHIVCPLIKKVPIIYPFVMIYRILRYVVLMCMGKKPSLIETSRFATERSNVYMNYQLYKVEDDK